MVSLTYLLVAPLLASSFSKAMPFGSGGEEAEGGRLERRQYDTSSQPGQFVLGAADQATFAPASTQREPDFVEAMLLEAKRKGMDLSQWGVEEDEMDKILGSLDVGDAVQDTLEEQSASSIVVDLNDEAQRLALLAEAAAEDTWARIQPIGELASVALDEAKDATMMQPGSGWIWNVCGTHEEAIVLQDINVKPDPPVAGRNLTVYAKGTVNADIEEGAYADVVVKLGFIRLLSRRFDICQLAKENDAELQCPLKPGEYEMTHTVELPREIPPAKFNVHVSGKTQADVDLMCMDVSIDFSH